MKNSVFCVAIAVMAVFSLPLHAQNAPVLGDQSFRGSATVEGIWQKCTFQKGESGETEIYLAPILKIISGDGTYNDVIIKTTAGGCVITGNGRYVKANDSLLVFQPAKMKRFDTEEPRADSATFRLEGPQWMLLERKPVAGEEPSAEIWMRLRRQPGSMPMLEGNEGDQKGMRPMGRHRGQQGKGRPARSQRQQRHGRVGRGPQLDERRLNDEYRMKILNCVRWHSREAVPSF